MRKRVSEALDQWWEQYYPGVLPLPYDLRNSLSSTWVRFHSLPDSKRYAESDDERRIILRRQNQLLDKLFGSGELAFVVQTATLWDDSPEKMELETGLELTHWRTIRVEDEEDSRTIVLGCRAVQPEERAGLIQRVADDRLYNAMFVKPRQADFIHPYDGGVDVFCESPNARDQLKSEFATWLPDNPKGL